MLGKQLQTAAAGNAGAAAGPLGVEDVFSTYLYTGTGSTLTITNGIDLAGEGGLVWLKQRNTAQSPYTGLEFNCWHDSARASTRHRLRSDSTQANQSYSSGYVSSFNSDGFTLDQGLINNTSNDNYASWTFRKAEKFFDVVTYTGDGSGNRTVSHNLGSVPGCIIVKCTSTARDWCVYHRGIGNTDGIFLNLNIAAFANNSLWNNTTPTSTEFTLGADASVNQSGQTYVAYVFAHDAGGFGEDETESVIKCGSYTGTSSNGNFINLGWEPQWVLIKRSSASGNWWLYDTMRGMVHSGVDKNLVANLNYVEGSSLAAGQINPLANGFELTSDAALNNSSTDYIYIAIRRGPMKKPTDATEVFNTSVYANGEQSIGFVPDINIAKYPDGVQDWYWQSRLTGSQFLSSSSTAAESTQSFTWDGPTGTIDAAGAPYNGFYSNFTLRRAPGFFDVVAYTGTSANRTVSHNLGVAPELMIVKSRVDGTYNWITYSASIDIGDYLLLNSNVAKTTSNFWNSTPPTSTVFSLSSGLQVNKSSSTYIAYLFASSPGVSKVGSYTGTGTTLDINCGFSAGARFVMIKRTDSTGDWYVWDTARGIVSGNDSYLLLNSTAAEVTNTDYIDPLSSGFQISSSAPAAINALNGEYIFLAIA